MCHPETGLPRRTLRSGKEYSAFDLALGHALTPPADFDFGVALQERLAEQALTGILDEEEAPYDDWPDDDEPPQDDDESDEESLPPPAPLAAPISSLSVTARNERKSRARCDKKCDQARMSSANPLLKQVHHKRREEAKDSAIQVDIDVRALPHPRTSWVPGPQELATGLGGISYTQQEVNALTGASGLKYVGWLGQLAIPIIDRRRRVVAVMGGSPRDNEAWKTVTDGAFALLHARLAQIRLPDDRLHHRRTQESFPALARGWSHSGGQTEPGELRNNVTNTRLTDELLAHEFLQHLAHFANGEPACGSPFRFVIVLFAIVFAACTFNFGLRAVCVPHLDFTNLAWGWCAITALGHSDPDFGDHLILWDLGLVISFPPGSTILILSALIHHSNVPIRAHEQHTSFMQYTAGGLFRWVRNGFKTDEAWFATVSGPEKAERAAEEKVQWEHGMNMLSVIDDL
ncbi:hypothetical protein K438DRAFT_1770269 [Mycena galopus ATCC 62051]|nr:hypothetical protein K438DRAFT_1770269 [Mycena galopus ATCC 62051]